MRPTASPRPHLVLAAVLACFAGCTAVPPKPPVAQAPAQSLPPDTAQAAPSGTAATTTATTATPTAATDPSEAQRFATWLAAFRQDALAAGIRDTTLQATLDQARFLPRTIALDRSQPEFTRSIWDYLDSAVSATRVSNGQARLAQVRADADAASGRFGVPPAVLAAVWGMESNYGQNFGDVPVIDALATLAFEGRRAAWAKGELIAALRIVQQGDIDRDHMVGSWAGAMGQTQFMPSAFLAHAVDADGDGRRDIWRSMPDVLASTANYLRKAGWASDEPCAPELRLPADFNPERADPDTRQDSAQWATEGLLLADGSPLPAMAQASVLQPAGATGPAFLVGRNFRAVLRYNNATSYALGVCLLAQRIDGGAPVQAAWPRAQRPLGRSEVKALQAALNQRGLAAGEADGLFGPATRKALRAWQRSQGRAADGFPTAEVLQALLAPPTAPSAAP